MLSKKKNLELNLEKNSYIEKLAIFDKEIFNFYILLYNLKINRYKSENLRDLELNFFSKVQIYDINFVSLNSYFYILFYHFLFDIGINIEMIFLDKIKYKFNRFIFNELFLKLKKSSSVKQLLTFSEIFFKVELEDMLTGYLREERDTLLSFSYLNRLLFFYFKSIKFVKIRKRFNIIKYWLVWWYLEDNFVHWYPKTFLLDHTSVSFFFYLVEQKRINRLSFNYKFFNKSLKEKYKIKKKKIYIYTYYILPYFRFLILNRFLNKYIFNIFDYFFNIYFLLNVYFNIIKNKLSKGSYSINFNSLICFFNRFSNFNSLDYLNNFITIIIKFKNNKKIKFFIKENFFVQELFYFLFLNLKFNYFLLNNLNWSYITTVENTKSILNFKSSKVVIKAKLFYKFSKEFFLSILNYVIFDKKFLKFLELNFDTIFNLKSSNKVIKLFLNFYFNLCDKVINKYCNLTLNYIRFFDIYIFYLKKGGYTKKVYSKLFLNLNKEIFFSFLYFKKYDLFCQNIEIKGYLLTIKNNLIKFTIPFFFILKLFERLGFIQFMKSKIIIQSNTNLVKYKINYIYNYYYKIYIYLFNYYYFFFNNKLLNKLFYILRKSCFLTLNLKLKGLNNFFSLKYFNENFFFNIKKNIYKINNSLVLHYKKQILNQFLFNFNIFDLTSLVNNHKGFKLKTVTSLLDTTRKEDIKFEKELDLKWLKQSLKLWDYILLSKFSIKRLILFDSKYFMLLPRNIDYASNFLIMEYNDYIFSNKIFEVHSFIYLVYFNYIFLIDYLFDLSLLSSHVSICLDKLKYNFKNIIYYEKFFYFKYHKKFFRNLLATNINENIEILVNYSNVIGNNDKMIVNNEVMGKIKDSNLYDIDISYDIEDIDEGIDEGIDEDIDEEYI